MSDNFAGIKFLNSAVEEILEKKEITITDYLAFKGFVNSESASVNELAEGLLAGDSPEYSDLNPEIRSYKELLAELSADLSVYANDGKAYFDVFYNARISTGNAVANWTDQE